MEKKRNLEKIILLVMFALYCIAGITYWMDGQVWYDAAYYAAQLFAIEYHEPNNPYWVLYVCRMLCPAASILVILSAISKWVYDSLNTVTSGIRRATAIYYDNEQVKSLKTVFRNPVFMGTQINRHAKSHVLMLEKDADNLSLYERMRPELKNGSAVYIKLEQMDPKLLKAQEGLYFFSSAEMIARDYWVRRNLIEHLKKTPDGSEFQVRIAIIGFDGLGQSILDCGLMNNIYSRNQSIHYHVWGQDKLYENLLGDFDKMNGDTVTFHGGLVAEDLRFLKTFDRIIITEEPNVELLQALICLRSEAEIDFYDPYNSALGTVYGEKLTSFGSHKQLLTEENIKTDKLIRAAKNVNYDYWLKNKAKPEEREKAEMLRGNKKKELIDQLWNNLNNFTKGSNISAADYQEIRRLINGSGRAGMNDESVQAEMEHIRWCRYHFVNHWSYAPAGKDEQKWTHNNLVRFAETKDARAEEKSKSVIQALSAEGECYEESN